MFWHIAPRMVCDNEDIMKRLFAEHCARRFVLGELCRVLCRVLPRDRVPVYVCIGVDRCTGDCFGPLTGTLLRRSGLPHVVGTLEAPVHAGNLDTTLRDLPARPFIVAVDAALGAPGETGYLIVRKGSLRPGKALNKNLPAVGDLSITLNVGMAGLANLLMLQSASLNLVWKGAHLAARGIAAAVYRMSRDHTGVGSG